MSVLIFGSTNETSLSSPLGGVSVFISYMTYREHKERMQGKEWDWEIPVQFVVPADFNDQWARADKKRIRIYEDQPINTSVFEEAEVVYD
jgi:hypothetical protein